MHTLHKPITNTGFKDCSHRPTLLRRIILLIPLNEFTAKIFWVCFRNNLKHHGTYW